ncbi:MAG: hypothetical protein AB7E36_03680 [Salinivirgaceae bacterium]
MLRLIKKIYRALRLAKQINWVKTLYFNFKMLPFNTAKKLPVVFYGKHQLSGLNGKVNIVNTPICFGIAEFGHNKELVKQRLGRSELRIDGILNINGKFQTGNDTVIIVTKGAELSIGDGSYFGAKTKVICTKKIALGKGFRFGFESIVSDSNYHFTINLETNKVERFQKEITIGDYCWVGNRSSIMKGTNTPNYLIVASNSVLNKDYTQTIAEYSLIGGIPAKLIKNNIVRVFDGRVESEIALFFANNPDAAYYTIPKE